MKQYRIVSPDFKFVWWSCPWPELRTAMAYYWTEIRAAPTTHAAYGYVLVLSEWESQEEAESARLDFLQEYGLRTGWHYDEGWHDESGDYLNLREAVDLARLPPKRKDTVIALTDDYEIKQLAAIRQSSASSDAQALLA